ncbi:MAG: hypothetical protein LUC93_17715 [Planctomycetaceae bacterium]|nr:hypothetical protein [Planctomycetaceae bacterium]
MAHDHSGMEEIEADILRNMLSALLGESVHYVGDAVADMPERRRANVVRICKIALKRLGVAVAEPGSVPPRVVDCLLGPGSYVQDAVSSAYWGGILACARSVNSLDDRAARKMHMLGRLGEYDLRSHYLFYTTLRLLLINTRNTHTVDFEDRFHLATFIPAGYYILAMDYNRDEITRMPRLISEMLYALGQEFLVDGSNTGSDEYLRTQFTKNTTGAIRGEGIVFAPAVMGIQLFLWAFGRRDEDLRAILDADLDCRIEGIQMGVDEAGLIYKEIPPFHNPLETE